MAENVMYNNGGKVPAKVTANPGAEKGLVAVDLAKKDKLSVKTLPNKDTEITFLGGKRGSLVVNVSKDESITFTYTNKNK